MNNKKDIGAIFEEELKELKNTPSEESWDKLNEALNKKDRKKLFLLWFSSGIAILLFYLFVFGLFDNQFNEDATIKDLNKLNQNAEEYKTRSSKKVILKKEHDSILEKTEENKDSSLKKQEKENPKKLKNKNKESLWDNESVKKTTKHYYYNSETKQNIETNDPSIIDSILKKNQKLLEKKNDSIKI